MDKVRLNNFILWCKGWYEPTKEQDLFEQALLALKLDGYELARINNVLNIVTNYVDDLVYDKELKPIRLMEWNNTISTYMIMQGYTYRNALLLNLRNLFRYTSFNLEPPTYSRKLYKMGFVCPRHFGNSYKMCNHKVKKFFES